MLGVQYIDLFECTLTTWNYRFGEGVSLLAHRQRFDSWTAFFAQHSVYEDVFLALVQPRYRTICKASKSNIYIYIYTYLFEWKILVLVRSWFLKIIYIYMYIYIYTYIYIYLQFLLAMQGYTRLATGKRDANWEIQVPIRISLVQHAYTRTYIADWQKNAKKDSNRRMKLHTHTYIYIYIFR